jgi:membrane protein DedA with SNARE-associated domain
MKFAKVLSVFLFLSFAFQSLASAQVARDSVVHLSTTERIASWYLDNINYGTVALLMTIESSFIPFPSEVVVPPAAYKASKPGSDLNIFLVVLFASIGALLGAIINYVLALWLGRPLIYRFVETRFARMCLLKKEQVEKAEQLFVKHGNMATLICRLIPGVRQLISVPAGFARMHFGNFVLFTFIGATAWNIILALIGYIAHGNADIIQQNSKLLSYVLLAGAILFVLYLLYNAFVKKPKKNQTPVQ